MITINAHKSGRYLYEQRVVGFTLPGALAHLAWAGVYGEFELIAPTGEVMDVGIIDDPMHDYNFKGSRWHY